MNLETSLPEALWEAVRLNYEKRNFTDAIRDAFYFLSELLRDKSGVEGDGASLIGRALGGASPKIKLNRLQTEPEQNIQKGMEQLLRGIYQCVRNPRSHGKIIDSEADAQTIIAFLGYLVTQIDQAKAQFSRADLVSRVFDPDFVPQERYAELLVAEIPPRARLDIFIDLYRENDKWKPENMRLFLKVLLGCLREDEIGQVCEVLTEDCEKSDSESSVRAVVGSFPAYLWPRIGEAARLRVENKLIRSVRDGRYEHSARQCRSGALGTWSTNIFAVMTLKRQMIEVISSKLWSSVSEERSYVLIYLFHKMQNLSQTMPDGMALALRHCLKQGDVEVHRELQTRAPWEESSWPNDLLSAYARFQAAESANELDDEIPF